MGPSHAMTCFFASTGLALLLMAAWISLADESVRAVSFGWPAVVALILLPLSSPSPGSYAHLSVALQGWVTGAVTGALGLAGIAAYQDGNVIVLAHASVGVTEACSGVRSLVSCGVRRALPLGGDVEEPGDPGRPRPPRTPAGAPHELLPVAGPHPGRQRGRGDRRPLARRHGGLAITLATTALLAWAAVALRRGEKGEDPPPLPPERRRKPRNQAALALTLGLLAALLGFLVIARRPDAARAAKVPDLEALFPAAPAGWRVSEEEDLAQFGAVLHTPFLVRRTYSSMDGHGPVFVSLYAAYWPPNQASASLVSIHTPDFCWPGSGFTSVPLPVARAALPVGDRILPPAECRLFAKDGSSTRVWFWHLFAGRLLIQESPYSVRGLLKLALSYDLRRGGDQLFVVVSSNRPWNVIDASPALRAFFARTAPYGL